MKQINFTFDRHHLVIIKEGKEVARFMPNWSAHNPTMFEDDEFYYLVELTTTRSGQFFQFDKYQKSNSDTAWCGSSIMPHIEYKCWSRQALRRMRLQHPSISTVESVLLIDPDARHSIFDVRTAKRMDIIA